MELNAQSKTSPSILDMIFGIDLRSLALFRIGLALIIIGDLAVRATDLRAHYTDFGVLPRYVLLEQFSNPWYFCLHLISGKLIVQAILFIINVLLALLLLVGYRTKLVTFLCWFFLTSLQLRNPMISAGGDDVLRFSLFWSMFLPLGACYSVDRAFNSSTERIPNRICSIASASLLLQVAYIYFFAWAAKTAPEWQKEGTAIYYALSLERFTYPLAQYLLQFPEFLKFMTHAVYWFEFVAPILLFIPVFSKHGRVILIFLFFLLNLGFGLCLAVGIFTWTTWVALIPFVPSFCWDKLQNKIKTQERVNLKIYYDADCNFCRKAVLLIKTFLLINETKIIKAQDEQEILQDMEINNSWVVVDNKGEKHFKYDAFKVICDLSPFGWLLYLFKIQPIINIGEKIYEKVANNRASLANVTSLFSYKPLIIYPSKLNNIFACFFLVYITLWQYHFLDRNFKFPEKLRFVGEFLHLDQGWIMFSPHPSKVDGWFVIPAKLRDGTEFDLFTGNSQVSWEKPKKLIRTMYKNNRQLKLMEGFGGLNKVEVRLLNYGRYLCRNWNEMHKGDKELVSFEIYFMKEVTLPDYKTSETKKELQWKHLCFGEEEKK